jgi:hypothetical protein
MGIASAYSLDPGERRALRIQFSTVGWTSTGLGVRAYASSTLQVLLGVELEEQPWSYADLIREGRKIAWDPEDRRRVLYELAHERGFPLKTPFWTHQMGVDEDAREVSSDLRAYIWCDEPDGGGQSGWYGFSYARMLRMEGATNYALACATLLSDAQQNVAKRVETMYGPLLGGVLRSSFREEVPNLLNGSLKDMKRRRARFARAERLPKLCRMYDVSAGVERATYVRRMRRRHINLD